MSMYGLTAQLKNLAMEMILSNDDLVSLEQLSER